MFNRPKDNKTTKPNKFAQVIGSILGAPTGLAVCAYDNTSRMCKAIDEEFHKKKNQDALVLTSFVFVPGAFFCGAYQGFTTGCTVGYENGFNAPSEVVKHILTDAPDKETMIKMLKEAEKGMIKEAAETIATLQARDEESVSKRNNPNTLFYNMPREVCEMIAANVRKKPVLSYKESLQTARDHFNPRI